MTQTIAGIPTIGNYVNRGNVATNDWAVGDFTTDGNWYDLDLSSIVPVGAMLVHFRLAMQDGLTNIAFLLKTKSYADSHNTARGRTTLANLDHEYSDLWVVPDADRVILYLATSTTWTKLNLNVRGWIIP